MADQGGGWQQWATMDSNPRCYMHLWCRFYLRHCHCRYHHHQYSQHHDCSETWSAEYLLVRSCRLLGTTPITRLQPSPCSRMSHSWRLLQVGDVCLRWISDKELPVGGSEVAQFHLCRVLAPPLHPHHRFFRLGLSLQCWVALLNQSSPSQMWLWLAAMGRAFFHVIPILPRYSFSLATARNWWHFLADYLFYQFKWKLFLKIRCQLISAFPDASSSVNGGSLLTASLPLNRTTLTSKTTSCGEISSWRLSILNFPVPFILPLVFSCPEQLNRWPCHSLTESLTHWEYFYFWHITSDPRDLFPNFPTFSTVSQLFLSFFSAFSQLFLNFFSLFSTFLNFLSTFLNLFSNFSQFFSTFSQLFPTFSQLFFTYPC